MGFPAVSCDLEVMENSCVTHRVPQSTTRTEELDVPLKSVLDKAMTFPAKVAGEGGVQGHILGSVCFPWALIYSRSNSGTLI